MIDPDAWKSLYPFASHELSIGGRRYHYLDEGQGDVLLFVHGNPTWSFYWRALISAFRPHCRCIAVDHIGCGLSEKPAKGDYGFRLQDRVSDLRALIERLDLKQITLLAHDWGGAIGMGAAVETPERFARFVLMNTAAFRAPRCPWRIRACRIPVLGRLAVQGLNLFSLAALRMASVKLERMTPEVCQGLVRPYDTWAHRTAVYEFVRDIPLSPSHPSYETLSRIEAGLAAFCSHPVCLIWGMRDWCFTPWFLDRFLEFFPQAEAHRLTDAGHYVVEDSPERIAPIVEQFLHRHPCP